MRERNIRLSLSAEKQPQLQTSAGHTTVSEKPCPTKNRQPLPLFKGSFQSPKNNPVPKKIGIFFMPFRCKSRKALKMLNKRRNVKCKMQNSKWKNLCHTVEIRYPEALRAKPVRNKPLRGKDTPILGTGWIPHKNIAVRRIKKGCQRLTTSSIIRSSLYIFHFAFCISILHFSFFIKFFFAWGLFFARWKDPLKSRDTWWNSEKSNKQ